MKADWISNLPPEKRSVNGNEDRNRKSIAVKYCKLHSEHNIAYMFGVRSGQEFSRTWSCLLLCGSCPLSTSPLLDYESRRKWKLQLTYSDTRTGVKINSEMALDIEVFMVKGKVIIYCHALTTPTVIVGPSHLCEWSGGAVAGGRCQVVVRGKDPWPVQSACSVSDSPPPLPPPSQPPQG